MKKLFLLYKTKEQYQAIQSVLLERAPLYLQPIIVCENELIKTYRDIRNINTPDCIIDNTLPIWNHAAQEAMKELIGHAFYFLISYELTHHEICLLKQALFEEDADKMLLVIYGHIPVMQTKNCIKLTKNRCDKQSEIVYLTDRKHQRFPVFTDCTNCQNIIYNTVPLSLHRWVITPPSKDIQNLTHCLRFSIEKPESTADVLGFFLDLYENIHAQPPYRKFTTAHFSHPVL